MSMNLTLHFEDDKGRVVREVTLWQTPTRTTNRILAESGEEKEAYFNWVVKQGRRTIAAMHDCHVAGVEAIFEEYTPDYTPVWGMI